MTEYKTQVFFYKPARTFVHIHLQGLFGQHPLILLGFVIKCYDGIGRLGLEIKKDKVLLFVKFFGEDALLRSEKLRLNGTFVRLECYTNVLVSRNLDI